MIPRRMRIDFSAASVRWAKDDNFSAIINAGSPLASAFEPYLNTVMAKARETLPPSKDEVKRNIDLFIAQEGNHYRVHDAYNKVLYDVYPQLRSLEKSMAADLKAQLRNKSLSFNLAYCTGFENLACYMAKFTYTKALKYFDGADRRVGTLFLWHNAEEFEHRAACSSALYAVSKNYFVRISGFIRFMRHAMSYNKKMVKVIFEADRAKMSPEERLESVRFEKQYMREFSIYVFSRMTQIFLPFYDPIRQTAPQALHEALQYYEAVALQPTPVTV